MASRSEDIMIDLHEAEEFGALARNWLEAEEAGDRAAVEAFENELHERITLDRIKRVRGLDPATGEPSSAETERVQIMLERMWHNASARLD